MDDFIKGCLETLEEIVCLDFEVLGRILQLKDVERKLL